MIAAPKQPSAFRAGRRSGPAVPTRKRFGLREYDRLVESGVFARQRLELIRGELIQMPPIGPPHAGTTGLAQRALEAAFGDRYWVRIQMPLHLPPDSAPEPDLAVVNGGPRDYRAHPDTALLVVEVSESTLAFDRTRKLSLYARNGLPEYWIVNLVDRVVEVCRDPGVDPAAASDATPPRRTVATYRWRRTFRPEETVSPLHVPTALIRVADLLP